MRAVAARLLVVLLGVLAGLALAGPAQAHVGGGAAGSDFDARIVSVSPAVPGSRCGCCSSATSSRWSTPGTPTCSCPATPTSRTCGSARTALAQPQQPGHLANLDRYGKAAAALPASVDAAAEPQWEQVSTEPAYVWHDHRTHWMTQGLLPPRSPQRPTSRTSSPSGRCRCRSTGAMWPSTAS